MPLQFLKILIFFPWQPRWIGRYNSRFLWLNNACQAKLGHLGKVGPAVVLPAKYDDVTHVTNNARALWRNATFYTFEKEWLGKVVSLFDNIFYLYFSVLLWFSCFSFHQKDKYFFMQHPYGSCSNRNFRIIIITFVT